MEAISSSAAFNIEIMAYYWVNAFGQATTTFIGQNYGAGKIERVRKGILESAVIYICGSLAISAFCLGLSGPIYRLFTNDADVIRIGISIMRFIAPFWVTFVGVEVLSSSIRSCGDSLVPMLITALGIGLFRIVWIVGFQGSTVFNTLLCYPVSWILTSILFIIYYFQGGWQKRASKQRSRLMKDR